MKKNLFKKLFAVAMSVAMCLSFAACGDDEVVSSGSESSEKSNLEGILNPNDSGKDNNQGASLSKSGKTIKIGEEIVSDGYASLKLVKMQTGREIYADLPTTNNGLYYNTYDNNETYADMIFDCTNLRKEPLEVGEMAKISVSGKKGTYDDFTIAGETTDGFYGYFSIEPLATHRVHFMVKVPTDEKDITFNMDINGERYSIDYTLDEVVYSADEVKKGEWISEKNIADVSVASVEFTDALLPDNITKYSSQIDVEKTGNTFLVINLHVKNNKVGELYLNREISVAATYEGNFLYRGNLYNHTREERDNLSKNDRLESLTEDIVKAAIEIPKALEGKPFTASIFMNGKEHIFKYSGN